jgi:hypothetical protein
MYFTYHPLEWEKWVNNTIGIEKFSHLKELALAYSVGSEDYMKLIVTVELLLKSLEN